MIREVEDLHGVFSATMADVWRRLDSLEAEVAALTPLPDSDRTKVARVCKIVGSTLANLDGRSANSDRARAANRVFRALREQGWSADRIGRATGYSARGITSNLLRFSIGISRNETPLKTNQ
jgi:hypothetical protein